MGKAGRAACIFVPWALTVASFVCLVLIELGGSNKSSGELNSLYFMQANFSGFTTANAGDLANSTTLTTSLEYAKSENLLRDIYQIHLWNFCTADNADGTIDHCSKRTANFVFDPLEIWGLNSSDSTSASTATTTGDNAVQSAIANAKNNIEGFENELLGESGKKALDAYRTVAKWMFIAYEVSFWTTLATIIVSILAIFSRIGSFVTWFLSVVSTIFTILAVLTSTILFAALTGALASILKPYQIHLQLGAHTLAITWLAALLSLAATLFWLLSVCCCSGASNPHHRANKGGLWSAEPKGQGYFGRGVHVEKTGGGGARGYQRVESPWQTDDDHHDRVPLTAYPQRPGRHPYQHGFAAASASASSNHLAPGAGSYEPFRRS
nr:sur7 family protein pun1 [Quercus suber]